MRYLSSENLADCLTKCSENSEFKVCVLFTDPLEVTGFLNEMSAYCQSMNTYFDFGELRFVFDNGSILYSKTRHMFQNEKEDFNELLLGPDIDVMSSYEYGKYQREYKKSGANLPDVEAASSFLGDE